MGSKHSSQPIMRTLDGSLDEHGYPYEVEWAVRPPRGSQEVVVASAHFGSLSYKILVDLCKFRETHDVYFVCNKKDFVSCIHIRYNGMRVSRSTPSHIISAAQSDIDEDAKIIKTLGAKDKALFQSITRLWRSRARRMHDNLRKRGSLFWDVKDLDDIVTEDNDPDHHCFRIDTRSSDELLNVRVENVRFASLAAIDDVAREAPIEVSDGRKLLYKIRLDRCEVQFDIESCVGMKRASDALVNPNAKRGKS